MVNGAFSHWRKAPNCRRCHDTGYLDWAGFAMEPCDCKPGIGHNGGPALEDCGGLKCHNKGCASCFPPAAAEKPVPSLPDDAALRNQFPMADGLLDYFPNALAEVSRLSYVATQQHHPEAGMHWDRSKSTDHRNKIMRHLVDTGKFDDKGQRHSAMVAWRALALLQEELEQDLGLPPSRASRNLPTDFATSRIG